MARMTRNSQRAAAEAALAAAPPSASQHNSPNNNQNIPPPSNAAPAARRSKPPSSTSSQASTRRRNSAGHQSKTQITGTSPTGRSPRSATRSSPPSTPPFRRPPTGTNAQRTVLGDLKTPPPNQPSPNPSEDEENDENDAPYDRDFSPSDNRLFRKYVESPELTDSTDIHWNSNLPVVQTALRIREGKERPDKPEGIKYYQENEWDTDDEEYPLPPPPRKRPAKSRVPHSSTELLETLSDKESGRRSQDMRVRKERRDLGKLMRIRHQSQLYLFPAPCEGPKVKLVNDYKVGQLWEGVPDTGTNPNTTRNAGNADENQDYEDDGILTPDASDIDSDTGLPSAEWINEVVEKAVAGVDEAEKEHDMLMHHMAFVWGELRLAVQDLREERGGQGGDILTRVEKLGR
ncbi:hypothetical protein NMY22_g15044 [Coprinellus aureogranulatus]|nr:hypothetical protein NMY22_g15044 [Coprinellus aureogranulatus]